MGLFILFLSGVGIIMLIVANVSRRGFRISAYPLPPGPRGLPVVGNINDLPLKGDFEAAHWLKHKYEYGPVSSLTILNRTMIIINDPKIASELLEKRSIKHSSRPSVEFSGKMVGWMSSLALCPYNDGFRAQRKNAMRLLGSKAAASTYTPLQETEAGHLLLRILRDPEGYIDYIRRGAGTVILKMVYGYTAEQFGNDPLIAIAESAAEKFIRSSVLGTFLVDTIPFIQYLPSWLPGMGFKRTAQIWKREVTSLTDRPYEFVKHQLSKGRDNQSFLACLLRQANSHPKHEWANKWSAASMYAAGADTIVSSMSCFFLAMAMFPGTQLEAQEEIDRVIGTTRLPNFADRKNLPYIEAVVKEVLRWHPVVPTAIPHMSTEDDVYQGYFIPKGSILIPNVWHFTHDFEVYSEPDEFKPRRFLRDVHNQWPEPDPRKFTFGFGRRVCPGRYFAENALFINVAQILAVFSISKSAGPNETELAAKFTPGAVSHPEPFYPLIKPRSAAHVNLVNSVLQTHPWEKSDMEELKNIGL